MGHRKFYQQFPLVNLLSCGRAIVALAALTWLSVFCEGLGARRSLRLDSLSRTRTSRFLSMSNWLH
jgi:hypothetical protein